jgi:hypothetical protein
MQSQSPSIIDKTNPQFSLCIPRISNNIGYKDIYNCFMKLNIGLLHRVDIVEKKNAKGLLTKRVFIHFKNWLDTENATFVKERLYSDKDIKIVYDYPWYWKVSLNKSQKVIS